MSNQYSWRRSAFSECFSSWSINWLIAFRWRCWRRVRLKWCSFIWPVYLTAKTTRCSLSMATYSNAPPPRLYVVYIQFYFLAVFWLNHIRYLLCLFLEGYMIMKITGICFLCALQCIDPVCLMVTQLCAVLRYSYYYLSHCYSVARDRL